MRPPPVGGGYGTLVRIRQCGGRSFNEAAARGRRIHTYLLYSAIQSLQLQ